MNTAATVFVALILTTYVALTVVGLYCAIASGRIVERALGRSLAGPPTAHTYLSLLVALFAIWIGGLAALLRPGGIHQHIAVGAEQHIHSGVSPNDRRKVRAAIREYRKEHGLK